MGDSGFFRQIPCFVYTNLDCMHLWKGFDIFVYLRKYYRFIAVADGV